VRQADVLVQNFRPRVAVKLGIDYATLGSINPRLVYAQISGYGEDGPMKDRPGQDLLVQSFAGLTMNAGRASGLPHPSPLYMVDVSASHLATEGILAALVARGATGKGQEVKVTMVAAIMEMQLQELTSYLAADAPPLRSASPQVSIWMEPPYGVYACARGHLAIAQADLDRLAEVIVAPDLKRLKASRPAQSQSAALAAWRDEIYDVVQARLAVADAPHWDALLSSHGLWCAVVNDYADFLEHPQTQRYLTTMTHPVAGEYRTVAPAIHFSDDPDPQLRAAPLYGADTREVLADAGFDESEIDGLIVARAAVQRSEPAA
jgi:crotonobetainyl-CoA:carnitine CoA-transferase CaiB-like acyl-CoA transferase